jgi:hypothetical protein
MPSPMTETEARAGDMLRFRTPVEDYREQYGLWVKREDLSCPPPGPPFSKTRGVFARVASRPEEVIGVLDTYHSQAGHAVARACQLLGKHCVNYYPEFKKEPGPREPQLRAQALGAELVGIPAGRSAILFHQARKATELRGGYMMPNALKLDESVTETAKECRGIDPKQLSLVIVPASSGTIAAGVLKGLSGQGFPEPTFLIHLGYSRSQPAVHAYLREMSGCGSGTRIRIVDEGYEYKDKAKPGETPPWPCNAYYDLKAFRWWLSFRAEWERSHPSSSVLFWNVG